MERRALLPVLLAVLLTLSAGTVFARGGGEEPDPLPKYKYTGPYDITVTDNAHTNIFVRVEGTLFGRKIATARMQIKYVVTGRAVDNIAETAYIHGSQFLSKSLTVDDPLLDFEEYGASRTVSSSAKHRWEWPMFFTYPNARPKSVTLASSQSGSSIIGTRVTY